MLPNKAAKSVFHQVAQETADLVVSKQKAYGDSFGKSGSIIKILYPNGISLEQYDDMLTIVRIIDKLFRIATKKDAFGESPWKDILGYALLAAKKDCINRVNINTILGNPLCRIPENWYTDQQKNEIKPVFAFRTLSKARKATLERSFTEKRTKPSPNKKRGLK